MLVSAVIFALIAANANLNVAATRRPTAAPSVEPTFVPTNPPSLPPTEFPSTVPTEAPTANTYLCKRLNPGDEFVNPVNISSRHGYAVADLHYIVLDVNNTKAYPYDGGGTSSGALRYCYQITSGHLNGEQAPVLRAYPGEALLVTLTNDLPRDDEELFTLPANDYCLERVATKSSTNLHFHGFHSQPVCHDDNIVMTIVNSGDSFTYVVNIPDTQPPGLYWYHPHIHHVADTQVMGGASGVIVIEGIENVQPEVENLPEQIMVFRGNAGLASLNFIPILADTPVQMKIQPKQAQFWRIANTMSDSELNMTLTIDGEYQWFRVIAQDGVSVGNAQTELPYDTQFLFLPTGGRVEVIVFQDTPLKVNQVAILETGDIHSGAPPNPLYVAGYQLMKITATRSASTPPRLPMATVTGDDANPRPNRVPTDLLKMNASAHHTLYFYSEIGDQFKWFIKVDNETSFEMFDINAPPAIIGTQGTVEDWTIINNTTENHDFHIHQMHFLVMEVDGVPVDSDEMQYQDSVTVLHQSPSDTLNQWKKPYQNHAVKIRVDFTGDVVGKFVFHCHLLFHEDHGMMRIVEVVPNPNPPAPTLSPVPKPNAVDDDKANDGIDDNNDDKINWVGLKVAIAILTTALFVLIVIMVYCCWFVKPTPSSAPSAVEMAASGTAV